MRKSNHYSVLFIALFAVLGFRANAATYKVKHSYPEGGPVVGKKTLLQFSLFRGSSPTPLTAADLQLEHEKLIHLMTIDSGFLEYHHEHPEEVSPGVWQLPIVIKTPGNYRVFMQMLPQDEILTKTVFFDDLFLETPQQNVPAVPVDPNQKLTFTDGEFTVTLNYVGAAPKQKVVQETYFKIEKNGIPVAITELDNYLGAKMHIAAISSDKKDFVHAHPGSHRSEMDGLGPTPDEIVKVYFQQSGYYGIFMQYSYKGVLHTNQFSLQVSK